MAEKRTGKNSSSEKSKDAQPIIEAGPKRLYRLPEAGRIAGVCAGLADYFDIDAHLLRIIFIILTLATGGTGVLIYLILAVVMPVEANESHARSAGKEISNNVSSLAEEFRGSDTDRLRNVLGVAVILLGVWLLLAQFFPALLRFNWRIVWPSVLILIGILIITHSRSDQ